MGRRCQSLSRFVLTFSITFLSIFYTETEGYYVPSAGYLDDGDALWLQGAVLEGNYHLSDPKKPIQDGISTNSLTDEDPELKSLQYENYFMATKDSNILPLTHENSSFIEDFVECVPRIQWCPLTSLPSPICPLACLLDHAPSRTHIYVLKIVMKSYCYPTASIFDNSFQTLMDHPEDWKRIDRYVDLLGITDHQTLSIFARTGVASLPFIVAKYSSTKNWDLIRPVVLSIEGSTRSAPSGFHAKDGFQNPACFKDVDLSSSISLLAELLVDHPDVSDLALPGYFLLSNIMHLPINPLVNMINAIYHMQYWLSGSICNIAYQAATGKKWDCKELLKGRNKRFKYLPPGRGELCGLGEAFEADLSKLNPDFIKVDPSDGADVDYEGDDAAIPEDPLTKKIDIKIPGDLYKPRLYDIYKGL